MNASRLRHRFAISTKRVYDKMDLNDLNVSDFREQARECRESLFGKQATLS